MLLRRVAAFMLLLSLPGWAQEAMPMLEEADALFRARRYAEALQIYRKAAEHAAAEADASCQAEALAQVARMCSLTGALAEGRAWLAKAEAVASPEHPAGWTRFLGVRGIFERESDEKERALATFIEMYDYALARELPLRAIDAAHHAALVAPADEQIAWAHKGIEAAELAEDEGWLAVLWNNLGATYDWELHDYPQAIECYAKARTYHYKTGGPVNKLAADWALGRAYLLDGQLEKAEELLPAALAKAEEHYQTRAEPDLQEWVGNCEQWLGVLRAKQDRDDEALALLLRAERNLQAAGMPQWWPEGWEELQAQLRALRGEE